MIYEMLNFQKMLTEEEVILNDGDDVLFLCKCRIRDKRNRNV